MKVMVIGDKELHSAIMRAMAKSKPQAQKVMKNAIEETYQRARSSAPVDTGFLKANIITRHSADSGEVHSQAGYSGFLEFGTRKMSAQPYMRPAFYAGRAQIIQDFEDVARGLFD